MSPHPRARLFTVFLPSRSVLRALEGIGITTTDQLVGYSEEELLHLPGIDDKSVATIKKRLNEYGYKLKPNDPGAT